jgi:hypothetical protein
LQIFTVTKNYRGDKFFVTEDNIFKVTPLFVVLAVIEVSDIIFAVDSIPAVFGVTLDPVVIYTSNMAAILSLRALYGFVASVIAELRCCAWGVFARCVTSEGVHPRKHGEPTLQLPRGSFYQLTGFLSLLNSDQIIERLGQTAEQFPGFCMLWRVEPGSALLQVPGQGCSHRSGFHWRQDGA